VLSINCCLISFSEVCCMYLAALSAPRMGVKALMRISC
jgi:hypothetical protein